MNAGKGARGGAVEMADYPMGDGATKERGFKHVGQDQIIKKPPVAPQQGVVLRTAHGRPDSILLARAGHPVPLPLELALASPHLFVLLSYKVYSRVKPQCRGAVREEHKPMSAIAKAGLSPVVQEAAPLRRKIAASLRKAVQTGALEPGARLVEKDLCQELNVSRTSLREALRELEAEGLIESGLRGLVVASITPEEAQNIYNVRAALEGLVAEQFAQLASEADQIALDRVVDRLASAYQSNDFPAIISEKDRFYEVLCLGARNNVVLDLLTRLNSRINRLRSLSRSNPTRGKDSLREIVEIAAALKRHDAQAAKAAAVHHIKCAAAAALGDQIARSS